jgi:PST family polysaccharide transporter
MAELGRGYWALVGMAVSNPMISAVAVWMAVPWLPGRPVKGSGVRSMLHVGGTVVLNSLVMYFGYNTEKILLGRFWGARPLGLYGRARTSLPICRCNNSFIPSATWFSLRYLGCKTMLSRLQRSFLKGYSVIVNLTIPITISCAIYAEEIVRILLGPKWIDAAAVLRLLAPTVLASALINPFMWWGMECNSPSKYAEAFYCRKLVSG